MFDSSTIKTLALLLLPWIGHKILRSWFVPSATNWYNVSTTNNDTYHQMSFISSVHMITKTPLLDHLAYDELN